MRMGTISVTTSACAGSSAEGCMQRSTTGMLHPSKSPCSLQTSGVL